MKQPSAVAFAGRMGTGKCSVSIALATNMGWKRASFGDFVRLIAAKRGLEPSRQVLQMIGAELESQDAVAFCKDVLESAGWHSGESIVVDGIRHVRVFEILRDLLSPVPVILVCLEAEEDLRKARLLERDGMEAGSCASAEAHSTEQDVISRLPDLADLRIFTKDGSQQEILQRIKDRLDPIR